MNVSRNLNGNTINSAVIWRDIIRAVYLPPWCWFTLARKDILELNMLCALKAVPNPQPDASYNKVVCGS